ncbi:hypothetical protein AAHC03_05721 [Spirometra sp. Aus1]
MDPSMFALLIPQREACPGSKEIWRIAPPSSNVSSWISNFDPTFKPHRLLGESMMLIVEKRDVHLFVNLTECLSSKFMHRSRSEKRQLTGRDILNEAGQQIIVTMPNNSKTVVRVNMDRPINEAIKTVCSLKKLNPSELKPFAPNGSEPLDPCLSFIAHDITELELKYWPMTHSSPNKSDKVDSHLDVQYLPPPADAKTPSPTYFQPTPSETKRQTRKKHRAPPPPTPNNLEPTNQQVKEPLRLLTATTEEASVNGSTTAPSLVEPPCDRDVGSPTADTPPQQPRRFERIVLSLDEASDQPSPALPADSTTLYEVLTTTTSTEVSVKIPLDVNSSGQLEANVADRCQRSQYFARLPLHPETVVCENDPETRPTVLSPPDLSVNTDTRRSTSGSPIPSPAGSCKSELPTPSPRPASSGFEAFSAKMVDCDVPAWRSAPAQKAATLSGAVRRRSPNTRTLETPRKNTTSLDATPTAFSPTVDELKYMLSVLKPTISQPQRTVTLCPNQIINDQVDGNCCRSLIALCLSRS